LRSEPLRVLIVFGTRPEAIKLCVLTHRLESQPQRFAVRVAVTAQHREMLDQVLGLFRVRPDYDFNLMRADSRPTHTAARVLELLAEVLAREAPDLVVVQGDTTTAFAAALAAYYARIPVAHVEAGLRTGNLLAPFPEEMHRLLTAKLSAVHFAATEQAARNLVREGIDPERIHVTGNTVIDAVRWVRQRQQEGAIPRPQWPFLDSRRKMILLTAHRRENFGKRIESIFQAALLLAGRGDVEILIPVHPNPAAGNIARRVLGGRPHIHLLPPLAYNEFLDLLARSYLILSDSGGVQEEAPAFGKPVLILRERTERGEAVDHGAAKLVGTDAPRIFAETSRLIEDPAAYRGMARPAELFGDGRASERIALVLAAFARRAPGSLTQAATGGR
jgi:UDP-N-acetylglucosamine 2-epimerase